VGDIVSVSTGVTYVGSTSVEVRFVVETFGLRGGAELQTVTLLL
jgi:acyl-CoA hydrolase